MALLLQPKRQPPAIQIETLIASSKRIALLDKTDLIVPEVYSRVDTLSRKRMLFSPKRSQKAHKYQLGCFCLFAIIVA